MPNIQNLNYNQELKNMKCRLKIVLTYKNNLYIIISPGISFLLDIINYTQQSYIVNFNTGSTHCNFNFNSIGRTNIQLIKKYQSSIYEITLLNYGYKEF